METDDREAIRRLVTEYERTCAEGRAPFFEPEEYMDIIEFYEDNALFTAANACLALALEQHPDAPPLQIHRARVLRDAGNWDEAQRIARQFYAPDDARGGTDDTEVLFFLAENELMEFRPDRADRCFEKIKEATRQDGECGDEEYYNTIIDIAETFHNFGYVDYAIAWYRTIPDTAGECYYLACANLSECYQQRGQLNEAEKLMAEVAENDPYNESAWVLLAEIRFKLHNYDEAADAADYALAINPHNPDALSARVKVAVVTDDIDDVLPLCRQAAERDPHDSEAALMLCELLLLRGKNEEAIARLTEANRYCPVDHKNKERLAAGLAYAYVAMGDTQRAYCALCGAADRNEEYSLREICFRMATLCLAHGMHLADAAAAFLLYTLPEGNMPDSEYAVRIIFLLEEQHCYAIPKGMENTGKLKSLWKRLAKIAEGLPPEARERVTPALLQAKRHQGC